MVAFPPCKINLGLQIVSKRPDGYHNIATCFYPVPWCDVLEVIPSMELAFSASGLPIAGPEKENLCLRAYELLSVDFKIPPARIHLHKIIPMGAGLGGGSSDGAWTLRLLNEKFSLGLGPDQLKQYAARLGSDCAFFVQDKAMLGGGRGEILEPVRVDLSGKSMVIVKPDVHVSTVEAYAGTQPGRADIDLKKILENEPVDRWKEWIKNDFEPSVFGKYPVISEIKRSLYDQGALYASMSGSGSAVFGIFSEADEKKISSKFEGLTCYHSKL